MDKAYFFVSWVGYDVDSELPIFGNSVVSMDEPHFNFKTFEIYLDQYLHRYDSIFNCTVLNYREMSAKEYEINSEDYQRKPHDDYNNGKVINFKINKR